MTHTHMHGYRDQSHGDTDVRRLENRSVTTKSQVEAPVESVVSEKPGKSFDR